MLNENFKNDKIKQGLLNWIKLKQKHLDNNIPWPLIINGFGNIAIYDINALGSTLAYELKVQCGLNVKYLIDDSRSISVAGLKALPLDSFDRIDDIDVVIVCSETTDDIENNYKRIKSKTSAQIKTFEWLFDRQNHYPLIIHPLVQLAYYLRLQGVDFYFVAIASLTTIENPSEREKLLKENQIWGYQQLIPILKHKDLKKFTQPALNNRIEFEDFFNNIAKVVPEITSTYKNGHLVFNDMKTKYINFINGNRFTTDTPPYTQNVNNVIFYGDSTAMSANTQDAETIPSHFQRLLNNKFGNQYLVQNYATPFGKGHILDRMLDTDFKAGDMVFCVCSYDAQFDLPEICEQAGIDYLNTNFLFNRPHNYGEVFLDIEHLGPCGNELIAQTIFDIAVTYGHEKKELNPNFDISGIYEELSNREKKIDGALEQTEEFQNYLRYLSDIKEKVNVEYTGEIGAIVVNCNPFTLGHKFLIDFAAAHVDLLYIFVVEEDLSIFPFKDRLQLVKAGTEHLKNIQILPSGQFIISTLTFPDYFNKGKAKNITVNVSTDVDLFACHIAPVLGITKRFVGTEPNCIVTRQYNDYMRKHLPDKGIDFIEIERKEINDSPISASRVRELLESHNFDEISKIVPKTTLNYLKSNKIS